MGSFSVIGFGCTVVALAALFMHISPGCNAQEPFYCDASSYGNEAYSIPNLPDQYSLRVEATFENYNRTVVFHELFDSINNRGGLSVTANGTHYRVIYDYEDDEIFVVSGYGMEQDCHVHTLSQFRFVNDTFGVTTMNGTLHIGMTGNFFNRITNDTPTNYLGLDMIRGIPTFHWQACVNNDNLSYIADYYYTTTDWNYAAMVDPGNYDMIPIQINVQGNSLKDGEVASFTHVYSIFDYRAGPDAVFSHFFSVPTGLACAGRIPGSPTPSVPDVFSVTVQYVGDITNNRVFTFREFYHLQHKLFRLDSYYDGSLGGSEGPVTFVHDFDTKIEYLINRYTNNCTVSSLGKDNFLSFDIVSDEGGNSQLISPRQFFLLGDEFNYTYEGVTTIRGVKVDSWLSVRDFESFASDSNLTDGVVELFFTRPEYSLFSLHSVGEQIVPWAIKLRGVISYFNDTKPVSQNISVEMDLFDFSTSEPSYDAFDVSVCFSDDDVHTLIIVFNVPPEGINLKMLRTNLRSSIIGYTNLKPVQVNNIQLLHANATSIIMSLHLANLSKLAQITDGTAVTAHWAYMRILNNTKPDSTLPFEVLVSDNTLAFPRLLRFGHGRNITNNCTVMNNSTTNSTCNNNITNRLKLMDGVLAGIAVALFFGGLLLGICVLLMTCGLYKCVAGSKGSMNVSSRGSSSVKYNKHDNELDNFSS